MSLLATTKTTPPPPPTNGTRTNSSTSTSSMAQMNSSPHPSTVGNSFVKQYYHLLAQSPEILHRFYKDDSKFTHGLGSHEEKSISGQEKINDKIMSMGYSGARVDLESGSVDCQASLDGGVLVMVTGIITLKSQEPKAFVQTFFLAVQPNGYFVLNDSCRYLEMPQHLNRLSPAPKKNANDISVSKRQIKQPLSPPLPPNDKEISSKIENVKTSKSTIKSDSTSSTTSSSTTIKSKSQLPVKNGWGDISTADETISVPITPIVSEISQDKNDENSVKKSEEIKSKASSAKSSSSISKDNEKSPKAKSSSQSTAPKSWASHLFSTRQKASSPSIKERKTATKSGWGNSVDSPKASNNQTNTETFKEKASNRRAVLYIRDIPSNTKEQDVRDLFKPYGNITGLTVAAAKGFAFVDYDTFDSVEAALACIPFTLLDKVINVEERPPERRDSNRYRDGRGNRGRSSRGGRGSDRNRMGGDNKNSKGRRGGGGNGNKSRTD